MQLFIFEHRGERPISRRRFFMRLAQNGGVALAVIVVSLVVGTAGYHWLGPMAWIDSFLNASMILGGMGPVGDIPTSAGKVFASLFALYAGVIFLVIAAVMLTPVFHRVLHRFHWDAKSAPGR
jgi:hypothetical protein